MDQQRMTTSSLIHGTIDWATETVLEIGRTISITGDCDNNTNNNVATSKNGCTISRTTTPDVAATTTKINTEVVAGIHKAIKEVANDTVQEVNALGYDLKDDMLRRHCPNSSVEDATSVNDLDTDRQDLFDLVGRALFAAVAIYMIADVRNLVREHQNLMHDDDDDDDDESLKRFLVLPIQDVECIQLMETNMTFIRERIDDVCYNLYATAMEKYTQELKLQSKEDRGKRHGIQDSMLGETVNSTRRKPNDLVIFDDANSKQELLYSIIIDRERKLLVVVFRGSVTVRDWAMNAKLLLISIPNPLHKCPGLTITQSKWIGIHAGFHQYLFQSYKNSTSKYDQILVHLRSLLKINCDYSVLCTGHSLGGALASLFAFRFAVEGDIGKPISCITFASPKVGNIRFVRAFQELELQQKIHCLRVANHGDVITQLPDRLTCLTFWCQGAIFRHVGVEMRLYRTDPSNSSQRSYLIRHQRIQRSWTRQMLYDWRRSLVHSSLHLCTMPCGNCREFVLFHGCLEYLERLLHAQRQSLHVDLRKLFALHRRVVGSSSSDFSLMEQISASLLPNQYGIITS